MSLGYGFIMDYVMKLEKRLTDLINGIEVGNSSVGVPTLAETYTIPANTQVLFASRMDIGHLIIDGILIEVQ